jgi:hypothetical protein
MEGEHCAQELFVFGSSHMYNTSNEMIKFVEGNDIVLIKTFEQEERYLRQLIHPAGLTFRL